MTIGLLGKKLGMTRIYDDRGAAIPVTVLQAGPCPIVQVKSEASDGYTAVQIGYVPVRLDQERQPRVNKPTAGHFKRSGVTPTKLVREFRTDSLDGYEVGKNLDTDLFAVGEKVDIVGISKGRGFAGSVKRNNQSRGPETHGSNYHRLPGSMGMSADPSHVFKGKRLPGRYGGKRITAQNLTVIKIDKENNLLVVRGSVPGHDNGYIQIRKSIKAAARKARG